MRYISSKMEDLIPKMINAWLLCQHVSILGYKVQLHFVSRDQKLLLLVPRQALEKEWLKNVLSNSIATKRSIFDILQCK